MSLHVAVNPEEPVAPPEHYLAYIDKLRDNRIGLTSWARALQLEFPGLSRPESLGIVGAYLSHYGERPIKHQLEET